MKRRIETRVIAFILMLVMMITILPAKSADAKTAKRMGAPAMAEKNVTLYIKGSYATSYAIQIKNITADAKITYSSSNRKIAVVNDEGIVTPLKKGTATISARVSQGGKNYKLNMVCKVQKAKLIFAAKKAQRTTEETPVTISVGNSLKTKLRLGGKAVSIFSQNKKDNNEFYNVKAVIYDAKTGKQHIEHPDATVLLQSAETPNPQSCWVGNQVYFEDVLLSLAAEYPHTVVAPVYGMFVWMQSTGKRMRDFLGNNINHPNDFGIRVYVHTILRALFGALYDA